MDNNSYKAVTIQNVDSEDFVFEYNRAGGNPPYIIRTGETVTYPFFLADHAVKHLIDKLLNKREISTANSAERARLAALIVIKKEDYHRGSLLTPAQQLEDDISTMNKKNDLEGILDKMKSDEEKAKTQSVVSKDALPELDTTEETFEGLTPKPEEPDVPETGPLKEVFPAEHKPVVIEPLIVKALPTRKELYAYAKDTLKMDMNKKTLDNLDKLKVNDLITELDFPVTD